MTFKFGKISSAYDFSYNCVDARVVLKVINRANVKE